MLNLEITYCEEKICFAGENAGRRPFVEPVVVGGFYRTTLSYRNYTSPYLATYQ